MNLICQYCHKEVDANRDFALCYNCYPQTITEQQMQAEKLQEYLHDMNELFEIKKQLKNAKYLTQDGTPTIVKLKCFNEEEVNCFKSKLTEDEKKYIIFTWREFKHRGIP